MLIATNPTTGKAFAEFAALTAEQASAAVEAAHDAAQTWRKTSFAERAALLRKVAEELRKEKSAMAEIMAKEMGKPINEGGPEVEKAAWCAEHYAEHAETYLARQTIASDASLSYVTYQPLGTILGILPWNAPLWLAFRFLAPSLMAGNTCVLKHDPLVPGCAAAIADAFARAGAPANVMVNLPIGTPEVEVVIRHPHIAAVSFTGSAKAGGIVASIAASEIKHSVLELGGSDPCIVLADADLEKAADVATLSRIINAGQSCIAAKRIIVEASIYDDFVERLKRRLSVLRVGDPLLDTTDVGPIARADLRDNLHRQVQTSISEGASCVLGGELPDNDGFFYPVTLLTNVTPAMCAFREETFGPVMSVVKAANADDALVLANDTEYGLGAAIWTADKQVAARFAEELQAGQVAVNGIVKTDPRLPSGGIKRSGFGRELGPHGIKEFVNAKQIWIA